MIQIVEKLDGLGRAVGYRVSGHALFAEAGQDIVCAAVSMLVINTVNSIEKFLPEEKMQVRDSDGFIEFEVDSPSDGAMLLLNSLGFGLEELQKKYGRKYIRIKSKG